MDIKREVAIVGGGISGLATAHHLVRKQSPRRPLAVTLLEASPRLGGILVSDWQNGFLFEGGPDSFVAKKPQARDLCRELGLEGDLIESRSTRRGAWLWWDGRLHRFPTGAFMRAPIPVSVLLKGSPLSGEGKRRVLEEPTAPVSGLEDESVAAFIDRRLGSEVLRRLVEPLVAGVYGGDASTVSARFAFPALFAYEKRHGRITTENDSRPEEPSSPFITLRNGVGTLSAALRRTLEGKVAWCLKCPVSQIQRRGSQLAVGFEDGRESLLADAVVLATPAAVSARLVGRDWPELEAALETVGSAPSIVGCFGYRRDVTAGRSGTGVLIPPAASRNLLACTWVHQKFPGRCPENGSQIRCFIGSRTASRLLSQSDAHLTGVMEEDLTGLLGVGVKADQSRIYRWPYGLPQYSVGHFSRLETIRAVTGRGSGLHCVGNYLDGVGVSDCIRHAEEAAAKLAGEEH